MYLSVSFIKFILLGSLLVLRRLKPEDYREKKSAKSCLHSLRFTPYSFLTEHNLSSNPGRGKDFEQERMFHPAINNVGFPHAIFEGIKTTVYLGQHPPLDNLGCG